MHMGCFVVKSYAYGVLAVWGGLGLREWDLGTFEDARGPLVAVGALLRFRGWRHGGVCVL